MRQKGKEKKEKRRIGRQNGEVVTKKREKKRGKGRKEKKRGKEREGGRDKNRNVTCTHQVRTYRWPHVWIIVSTPGRG